MSQAIPFAKMVGAGNDFVVVDARREPYHGLRWPSLAKAMCDRRYGIGADGLLVLQPSRTADARMRIFNADGSEADMCGNGARCAGWLLSRGSSRNGEPRRASLDVETGAGRVGAEVRGQRVIVELSEPRHYRRGIVLTVGQRRLTADFLDTGVPHAVIEVPRVQALEVDALGRAIRHHPVFRPRGANVNFIQPEPGRRNSILIRTYERGVEAETLACGTGATAAALCFALRHDVVRPQGRTRLEVVTRGGERLAVSFAMTGDAIHDVRLEGPVRHICNGTFQWPTRERG